ncbi:archease [Methylocystis hirsuta]|uniref:Archease n=1 Tax=Methylocystis hirsuta TaxID=369798 RepID=A0A3M9XM15_9HYPH|nr:archease [Methylocystis hirsuta]RNJ47960.1 archease [Methylocystis hirsuta]
MGAVSDHSAVTGWEHFPHDADIGVRGYGATPGEACEQAALAMMATILDPGTVRLDETVEVAVEAPRLDLLLVDWLNALIYEMAERRMVFGAFHVKIENDRLKGRALGEAVSRARHAPAVEVKGATYTELAFVEDRPGLWRAQCVIDV